MLSRLSTGVIPLSRPGKIRHQVEQIDPGHRQYGVHKMAGAWPGACSSSVLEQPVALYLAPAAATSGKPARSSAR
jgi:hypothetical protein